MRGSWVTTFAVSGVIILLTVFLGLQYKWLEQAGEAERERMQRRVEADTRNFANDFNRELQSAYFSFQTDPVGWEKGDWAEFGQRYDFWRSKAQYPELIRELVYFRKGYSQPFRYDPSSSSFVAIPTNPEIENLRSKIEGERVFRSYLDEERALVMPIHKAERVGDHMIFRRTRTADPPTAEMPESIGFLAIRLDSSVLTERLLPGLAAKHFPEGNFRISVTDQAGAAVYQPFGAITGSDAKAGLIDLAPDNVLLLSNRGMWSQFMADKAASGITVNERIESKTFTHSETTPEGTKTGTFTVQLKPGKANLGENVKSRTSVLAAARNGGDPWTLNVAHTSGSIDAFTRGEFIQSFVIGMGVYLLLVGAIVAIVISALRSKRVAQRQIDFVSSVSHEFRTPLAVIFSAGENLADGVANDSGQVSRYGDLIKTEGRKLSGMVEQILQYAGARSGKKRYNFSETDVASVVNAAVAECSPILEENDITLVTDIDPDIPSVLVDADALSSAIRNLISNAVKYGNGGRWIKVAASNGGVSIKLSVEDRGIGIAQADLKHIFEPFYRAKKVVDAQIHGSGLGLALVKEIADAHGGSVSAASELGKGSMFVIEFPVTGASDKREV